MDVDRPVRAAEQHAEAVGPERLEVRAARDERDVVPTSRQERAEVPADRAGPVDEDVHRAILPGARGP